MIIPNKYHRDRFIPTGMMRRLLNGNFMCVSFFYKLFTLVTRVLVL